MRKLRALTFLAPNMLPVYRYTLDYVSGQLGCAIDLAVGTDYNQLFESDLAFVCGLPYVLFTPPRVTHLSIEAVAAPVLQGERFQNKPIYFSDVIVRQDSPFQSFIDLRGHSWAYNEPYSQSGYGITRYWLAKMGETQGFFSKVVEAGFHQNAIRLVNEGRVDASAIDAQVLAVELRDHPELAGQLRVIDSLGPSPIQPLVVSSQLSPQFRQDIRNVLAEIHSDSEARAVLEQGFIDHFVAVSNADYDDIRAMLATCEKADFLTLK